MGITLLRILMKDLFYHVLVLVFLQESCTSTNDTIYSMEKMDFKASSGPKLDINMGETFGLNISYYQLEDESIGKELFYIKYYGLGIGMESSNRKINDQKYRYERSFGRFHIGGNYRIDYNTRSSRTGFTYPLQEYISSILFELAFLQNYEENFLVGDKLTNRDYRSVELIAGYSYDGIALSDKDHMRIFSVCLCTSSTIYATTDEIERSYTSLLLKMSFAI